MKPLIYSVLPRPPHPSRDGLAIRNFYLLAALSEVFRVRAFSLLDPQRAYGGGQFPAGVEIEWVPQSPRRPRRMAAAAASVLSRRPYSQRLYRSRQLELRLASLAQAQQPRWIVAHSYHVAPAALAAHRPVWVDFHNLDSEVWGRTADSAASGPVRLFARLQQPRVRGLERRLVAAAAGLSCVSRRDADALRALGTEVDPLVVPNGVDLSHYPLRREPAAEELVFFVGDLSWPPNADGVRWFARSVWPRVKQLRPAARAEILGRSAPPDLKRLASADFALPGEGADTRPSWARAAVAIVPLLAGGGTRLKILEAAACGVPVVSTPVGAEGLDFTPETEILLRADAEGFAAAVAGLLADPDAAVRQAAAARARVEALYDWARIGREFASHLARAGGDPS
jgi:glycosyltransferase involved in cell wall biosynthesis